MEEREFNVEWNAVIGAAFPREACERFLEYVMKSQIGRGFWVEDLESQDRVYVDLDEPQADGGVTICPNCGQRAEEDEDEGLHYCPRCDLQLDHLTAECPECGSRNTISVSSDGEATPCTTLCEDCHMYSGYDKEQREYNVVWSYETYDSSPEEAAKLAQAIAADPTHDPDRVWTVTDVASGESFDVQLPPAAPAAGRRPTVITSADADDWLHLQRDGFDVFHGTRVFHDEDDDLEGRPNPDLSDDEYQQLIDVICEALGVADQPAPKIARCIFCGTEDATVQFTYFSTAWPNGWFALAKDAGVPIIESPGIIGDGEGMVCHSCREKARKIEDERAEQIAEHLQNDLVELQSRLALSDDERLTFWRRLASLTVNETVASILAERQSKEEQ